MSSDTEHLAARRARALAAWGDVGGPVLVAAGLPVPIAGTDQFHDFHAHGEFRYLTSAAEAGAALGFDPESGWTLFTPAMSAEERVWMSPPPSVGAQAEATGLADVREAPALQGWLEARRGRGLALLGNPDISERPSAYGADGWQALELEIDEAESERLSRALSETRRAKDGLELAHLQAAVDAAVEGHLHAWATARPGMTERGLQIELEAQFFRRGGERTAYHSIVACGPRSAVLHGDPGADELREGQLVLIDAGPEVCGYASDVTRTFPAGRGFTGAQRELYDVVLTAQREAISSAGPGVEYKDLHLRAAETIAAGLVDAGVLRGAPAELVERDAHALFFPHGLGHMLGLATHDCGGYLEGREPEDRFGLSYLRTDLPLEPGYVVTIEPGIYFIPALLQDEARRERYRDAVNWERVDGMLDFGGIRIEDDVAITEDGCRMLSAALPSDAEEIEARRREALGWAN